MRSFFGFEMLFTTDLAGIITLPFRNLVCSTFTDPDIVPPLEEEEESEADGISPTIPVGKYLFGILNRQGPPKTLRNVSLV